MPGRPKVRASSGGGRFRSYILGEISKGNEDADAANRLAEQEASKKRMADYENQIKSQNEARDTLNQIQALATDKIRQDPKLNYQDAWLQAEHEIFSLGQKPITEKGYSGARESVRGQTLTNDAAALKYSNESRTNEGDIAAKNALNAYIAEYNKTRLPSVKSIVETELGKERGTVRGLNLSNTAQEMKNELERLTQDSNVQATNTGNRAKVANANMDINTAPYRQAKTVYESTAQNTGPSNPQRTMLTPSAVAPFFNQRAELNPNFVSHDPLGADTTPHIGATNITRFPDGSVDAPLVAGGPAIATPQRAESAPAVDTQALARRAYASQLAKTLQDLGIQQPTGVVPSPVAPQTPSVTRKPYAADILRSYLMQNPNGNYLSY